MGFKCRTFILWKWTKIFCNRKCGVTNNMLFALSHNDSCRNLRWSFFATEAHNSQPYISHVSMIPVCVSSYLVTVWMIWRAIVLLLLRCYCFETNLLMIESRHIENLINIDEINPLKRIFGFFTVLKKETTCFLMFSGFTEIEHSLKMG